jgi:hypothetical protein
MLCNVAQQQSIGISAELRVSVEPSPKKEEKGSGSHFESLVFRKAHVVSVCAVLHRCKRCL